MPFATDARLTEALASAPPVSGDPSPEAAATREALLRQFQLQRMIGYGMELGDALALRRLVEQGHDWTPAGLWLADRVLALAGWAPARQRSAIRAAALRRASACLRIAQVVTESDSDQRRAIYGRAEEVFACAVAGDDRYRRVAIPHPSGDLIGWLYAPGGIRRLPGGAARPAGEAVREPLVVVVGGVEGWGLDLEGYALALAEYGLATLLLDGPGQGQTRFQNRHFLSEDSMSALCDTVSYASEHLCGGRPVGLWGNSLGGNFAMHVAHACDLVAACCNNGGSRRPGGLGGRPRFLLKMAAMCGGVGEGRARDIFASLALTPESVKVRCPLLVVHGGVDPLLTNEESQWICEASGSGHDLVLVPDGDHSIYNRPADKFAVVGAWFAEALGMARGQQGG